MWKRDDDLGGRNSLGDQMVLQARSRLALFFASAVFSLVGWLTAFFINWFALVLPFCFDALFCFWCVCGVVVFCFSRLKKHKRAQAQTQKQTYLQTHTLTDTHTYSLFLALALSLSIYLSLIRPSVFLSLSLFFSKELFRA